MFEGESLRVDLHSDGIAELCFDRRNESINKLDVRTVTELEAATNVIRGAAAVRGVLVTSAKEVFIVGADIFEFTRLFARPAAEIEAHITWQNTVFVEFEDLPVPIVTALNGLALGGGLELALATDARVMAEQARVGLPEVSLGLFPGLGGTVRLPRASGVATAVEWITKGKQQEAGAALAAGVVDVVVPPERLRSTAVTLLESLCASGEWRLKRQRRHGPVAADSVAFGALKGSVFDIARHEPAALAAIELLERTAPLPRDQALKLEHAGFAVIARTQAAAALVQTFINDQAVKKQGKAYVKLARRPVNRLAVVGAGIMGGGIAYTAAARGTPVVLKDITQGALDLGMAESRKLFARQVESGRLRQDKADELLDRIRPTLDYSGFESVDLVVEAVVENTAVKKAVLAEISRRVGPEAIIVSNTSSLSLSELGRTLERPENFAGLHFFNPVPAMPLVEVIRGAKTSAQAVAAAAGFATAIGKIPVVVRECPGFLVNRILTPYLLGFLRAVQDGADFVEIDRVMEGFGWPMGPAYLSDVIGMDTLQHVLRVISAGFGERMRVEFRDAVAVLVEHGRLGQKSGAGFYRYERDARGRPLRHADPSVGALLARPAGRGRFTDQELCERLMLPMIIEAARCLDERIVESAAEVDMSLVLGLGFPRFAGGPLKYADWVGLTHVVARCDAYASLGGLYVATEAMRVAAARGGKFYSGDVAP